MHNSGGKVERRTAFGDLGIEGWVISKCILKNKTGKCEMIYLAHDGKKGRTLVNEVMNLQIP